MRKISLDTNAFSAIAREKQNIIDYVSQADKIYISFIVYGELLYGFKHGEREQLNRLSFESFLSKNALTIQQSTLETVEIYSDIASHLRSTGNPIPTNDIWIAAQAIEMGSILVTQDQHFTDIPGLRLWSQ